MVVNIETLFPCLILLTAAAACFYMLFRNDLVYNYKMSMLKEVSKLASADIKAGREWEWRYEYLKEHYEYNKMVLQLFTFHWELPAEWFTNKGG